VGNAARQSESTPALAHLLAAQNPTAQTKASKRANLCSRTCSNKKTTKNKRKILARNFEQ
jgi:hypothetical protein